MKLSTASANASTVTRSRIFVMLGAIPREVCDQVQRAGHEHRPDVRGRERVRPQDRARSRPVRSGRQRGRRAPSAGSARGFEDCVATSVPPSTASAASIAAASLSREDRDAQRVVGGSSCRTSQRTPSRLWAPSRISLAAPLEPARAARPRPRARSDGRGRPPPPRGPRRRRTFGPAERGELARPEARRSRPPARPRASRPRSPRGCRRARRCARARRSSAGRRATSRTLVASSRPPRPASTTATSTSRAANSANAAAADRLELRRAGASASGLTRATRRLEVGVLAVDADPLGPAARRAARSYAPTERPSARSSASIVSVARRLAVRADDVDRRERALRVAERARAAPASARARTSSARASATRARRPD